MGIQLKRELELQSHLSHPNILKLLAYFEDKDRVFLVVEFAKKGELFALLQSAVRFDEARASRYIKSTALALEYCHSMNCLHRDLKPENILIDHNDQVKLADFGWGIHTIKKRKTYCGTLDYLCPEIVEKNYYDGSVDRWCLGVLTYELTTGGPPFQSADRDETFRKIVSLDFKFPSYLSEECKDFIRHLIVRDPAQRMTFSQCLKHPWITKYNPDVAH